jgi:Radical SAM superfamily.
MNYAEKILGKAIVSQGLKYVSGNPEENLPKILSLGEKIAIRQIDKENIRKIRQLMEDPNNNWRKFAITLLTRIDPHIREKTAGNFFVNACLLGNPTQYKLSEKYDINVPWAILIDPTAACNLKCVGCWAGEYNQKDALDYDTLNRVIGEAEELGIFFTIFSGGEPTVRKKDLIKLAEAHPDSVFLAFTNGTLIDDEFIKEVKRVGNLAFAVSIDGFEETTDARRGNKVYQRVMTAMEKMRDAGIIFGFSTTYMRGNIDEVSSDEFVDLMIEKGCIFGWYFTYVPVGRDADPTMMATPTERAKMYKRINEIRNTKPIFVLDFWNDGEYAYGCIAGGRRYLHINANGDVEPCAFVHYATCNIKDTSLLDALKSPLMMEYRRHQPFNENMLRPCPLIDNPEALQHMVHASGAHSTQMGDPEDIDEFYKKIKPHSDAWAKEAEELWKERQEKNKVSNENDEEVAAGVAE